MWQIIYYILCTVITLSTCSNAAADDLKGGYDYSPDVAALIRQAEEVNLADNPYWHALLHYRKKPLLLGAGVKSDIISPEFFLSKTGSVDSWSELKATLEALFSTVTDNPDQHAQCRFVARYKWLKKSLNWGAMPPPRVECEQFRGWSLRGRVESISLIFATGYLSNPASYFGHLVLKFNAPDEVNINQLLDTSANYGAIVPKHENPIVYILKGVFGGYEAAFSHDKFYRHNHNYTENELRDLWEYELALNSDEVDQIVSHSWELLRVKFVYHFFKENCAYRLAELLELVINQPLLPRNMPWSIPHSVFDKLADIERDGIPLVKSVRRIPSRQNRFYEKYFALDEAQQNFVRLLANGSANFKSIEYRQLSDKGKIRTIETLFDYSEFLIIREEGIEKHKHMKQDVLIERLKLPRQNSTWQEVNAPPPHYASPPSMAQASLFQNSKLGSGIELRLRPAYYDFLSLDAGRVPYSTLSMFDLRIASTHNGVRFRSLALFNIETLNLSKTGLPGDGGFAWKIKLGLEQQDLSCDRCTIFSLDSGIGKALPITDSAVAYGMLEARAKIPARDTGTLATTARIGVLLSPAVGWKTQLYVGHRAYLNGLQSNQHLTQLESSWSVSRKIDWRVIYEKQGAREIKTSLSYYF